MCHSREPYFNDAMLWLPKGIVLETKADVARNAKAIFLHAGVSQTMPPPNVISTMTEENRIALISWYKNSVKN